MAQRKIIAPELKKEFTITEGVSASNDEMTPAHQKALTKVEKRQAVDKALAQQDHSNDLISFSDQLAGTRMYIRHYKWQGSDILFPLKSDAMLRFVDKAYRYTDKGLLLVDEPKSGIEYKRAQIKKIVLKERGFRYVVVISQVNKARIEKELAGLTVEETKSVFQLKEQLGEL